MSLFDLGGESLVLLIVGENEVKAIGSHGSTPGRKSEKWMPSTKREVGSHTIPSPKMHSAKVARHTGGLIQEESKIGPSNGSEQIGEEACGCEGTVRGCHWLWWM